jgi:hypothetical protein
MINDAMKIKRNNLVEIRWVFSSYSSVEVETDGNIFNVVR